MTRPFLTIWLVFGVLLTPRLSLAQRHLWGEVGTQQVRLGNGQRWDDVGYGAGFDLMFGGRSQHGGGLLLVIGDEARADGPGMFFDNLAFVDLGLRVKNVTLGPGVNFAIVARSDVEDLRCKLSGAALQQYLQNYANGRRTTCVNTEVGTRSLGNVSGLGGSGFARLTFGPRAHGFVEARLIVFPPAEFKAEDTRRENISHEYPETDSAWDGRATAGYAIGGGRVATLVRVQYIARELKFKRQFANGNDIFNQSERQFTLGLGLAF